MRSKKLSLIELDIRKVYEKFIAQSVEAYNNSIHDEEKCSTVALRKPYISLFSDELTVFIESLDDCEMCAILTSIINVNEEHNISLKELLKLFINEYEDLMWFREYIFKERFESRTTILRS